MKTGLRRKLFVRSTLSLLHQRVEECQVARGKWKLPWVKPRQEKKKSSARALGAGGEQGALTTQRGLALSGRMCGLGGRVSDGRGSGTCPTLAPGSPGCPLSKACSPRRAHQGPRPPLALHPQPTAPPPAVPGRFLPSLTFAERSSDLRPSKRPSVCGPGPKALPG